MAISLKENGFATKIIGVDHNPDNIDKAYRRRLIDEDASLSEAIKKADILLLATPVDVIVRLLPGILDEVNTQIVMDVGSTKVAVVEAVKNHPKRSQFVASHPMAGTEYSGPEAAIPNLFDNKCTVICDASESNQYALSKVIALYESMQMQIVHLGATEHDVHTAYVSHISHISSFALALDRIGKGERRKTYL